MIGTIRRIGRPRLPRRAIRLDAIYDPIGPSERLFLPPDYRDRADPDYYSDTPPPDVVYQPDVYSLARTIAIRLGSERMIDVGCGAGEKLIGAGAGLQTIGIDYGVNLEQARGLNSSGTWIEHDLSTPGDLPLEAASLESSIVICADVVEHLVDPLPLLNGLARTLPTADAVLISTPDRNRLSGAVKHGPPGNPSHIREWTRDEFARLLRSVGFDQGIVSYTRPHTGTLARSTTLAVLVPESSERVLRRSTWRWR